MTSNEHCSAYIKKTSLLNGMKEKGDGCKVGKTTTEKKHKKKPMLTISVGLCLSRTSL